MSVKNLQLRVWKNEKEVGVFPTIVHQMTTNPNSLKTLKPQSRTTSSRTFKHTINMPNALIPKIQGRLHEPKANQHTSIEVKKMA